MGILTGVISYFTLFTGVTMPFGNDRTGDPPGRDHSQFSPVSTPRVLSRAVTMRSLGSKYFCVIWFVKVPGCHGLVNLYPPPMYRRVENKALRESNGILYKPLKRPLIRICHFSKGVFFEEETSASSESIIYWRGYPILVGSFNPFGKICSSIWDHFPRKSGWKFPKMSSKPPPQKWYRRPDDFLSPFWTTKPLPGVSSPSKKHQRHRNLKAKNHPERRSFPEKSSETKRLWRLGFFTCFVLQGCTVDGSEILHHQGWWLSHYL